LWIIAKPDAKEVNNAKEAKEVDSVREAKEVDSARKVDNEVERVVPVHSK
jgi:hypothetical protein